MYTVPRPVDEKPGDYRRYCNTRPGVKEVRDQGAKDLRNMRRGSPELAKLFFRRSREMRRWVNDFGRRVIENGNGVDPEALKH